MCPGSLEAKAPPLQEGDRRFESCPGHQSFLVYYAIMFLEFGSGRMRRQVYRDGKLVDDFEYELLDFETTLKEAKMADVLTKMYDDWAKSQPVAPTQFSAFQAGLTAGAVSMRSRALKVAQDGKASNDVINKIGSLSDIPE